MGEKGLKVLMKILQYINKEIKHKVKKELEEKEIVHTAIEFEEKGEKW